MVKIMASINKEDFDKLHEKVDNNSESLARIEGKLDGAIGQQTSDWTNFGIIGAIAMGLWNMLK